MIKKIIFLDVYNDGPDYLDQFFDSHNVELSEIFTVDGSGVDADNIPFYTGWDYLVVSFKADQLEQIQSIVAELGLPEDKLIFVSEDCISMSDTEGGLEILSSSWKSFLAYIKKINEFKAKTMGRYVIVTAEGLSFANCSDDECILPAMYDRGEVWSKAEMTKLLEVSRERFTFNDEQTIFCDFGANIGTTSIYFKKKLDNDISILAFEPSQENYKLLSVNMLLNNIDESEVTIEKLALSDTSGECEFSYDPTNPGGSGLVVDSELAQKEIVKTVPFDEYVQQTGLDIHKIKYIWVDLEGHEPAFVRGAKNTLSTIDVPIIVEFTPKSYKGIFREYVSELAEIYDTFIIVATEDQKEYEIEKLLELEDSEEQFDLFLLKKKADDTTKSEKGFDTLVVITPKDCARLSKLYPKLINSIPYGKVNFVGSEGVSDVIKNDGYLSQNAGWIDEDSIIPFKDVHACMAKRMENILAGRELPRGITGWYYQQFLKMQYALCCKNEYYLVWDGDTIPCKEINMFQKETGKPYIDLKYEYHEEYFETMGKILNGFGKVIEKSFISEHMLIKAEYMKELIRDIESNDTLPGTKFWEKIINSIDEDKIQSSAFSEFETYGTYVAMKHCSAYALREWHSFRQGGTFYDINTISDRDFRWLSKDFDAISFEKGHTVREDNANLFDNPYYQEKLTPKQMLQAAQMEYKEGYKEVWDDDLAAKDANTSAGAFVSAEDFFDIESKLKYLNSDTYMIYEKLGDNLSTTNVNQAFLCYENAEFLCEDDDKRKKVFEKKMRILDSGKVKVRKTAFVILSYNNKYLMQRCLESIYTNCNPDSYLLVVFDNGSTDGVAEWLSKFGEQHDEAYIILSTENLGFSGGCNEACKYVPEDYDIFFLNNDVRVPANALFWLRMALYDSDDVGGVGAVQNYMPASTQENVKFGAVEQYMEFGAENNVPTEGALEEKSVLCGFAMLLRRDVYDRTGGFDEAFNPGYLEDDDISLKVRSLGYKLLIAHNAFIYHAGTQSFRERDDLKKLFEDHRKILIEKWNFDSRVYCSISDNERAFVDSIKERGYDRESKFSLVHVGCGCGDMLGRIKYLYPVAEICGVEEDGEVRQFAITSVPVYASVSELPKKLEDYDFVAQGLG